MFKWVRKTCRCHKHRQNKEGLFKKRGDEQPFEAGMVHTVRSTRNKYLNNHVYLHKLTFGAVFLAPRDTQSF